MASPNLQLQGGLPIFPTALRWTLFRFLLAFPLRTGLKGF
jgi:hypothetical protein